MKHIMLLFFVSLIFTTCTRHTVVSAQEGFQFRYVIIPESPRPGDPVTIAVNIPAKEALLFANGRQVTRAVCFPVTVETPLTEPRPRTNRRNAPQIQHIQHNFTAAILTIPSTVDVEASNLAGAFIRLNGETGVLHEIPITIEPREFRSETIRLTPALTRLVSEPDPQRTSESQRLWQILSTTGNQVYHAGQFIMPVTSTRRTSSFGTRRVNLYSDGRRVTDIHAGIDFGIPTGTEVFACGRGRVALARMRIISGYSVIIEHAPGIYSIYYHLDSVSVEEGAIVEAGEVIGLSGSTGFSTGPHLHWELRVNTENTDPDAFAYRPLIDKDLIISRLFN